MIIQGFECPQSPITLVSSELALKSYLHFNWSVKQKIPCTICAIKMYICASAAYCKQISRVECPAWHVIHPMDTAFAPEICHYSHKMDLGINLDPVCWTEVGLLQRHLSVTF